MSRRSRDWNEGLARDLQDPGFAAGFILAALDEGVPLESVLAKIIRAYGLREFSKKTGIASPNLLRVTHPRYNPTQRTLNRILKPFGLRLTVAPLKRKRSAA